MSKKSNQKPEPAKTEKTEAVEGAIETKAQEPAEETPGQDQANAATSQAEENPASESAEPKSEVEGSDEETAPASVAEGSDEEAAPAVEHPAANETDEPVPPPLPATPVVAATSTNLATRLTKTVNAMLATGEPEVVHALHKAEMIVGDLKNALPAAVDAADESLKADLQTLLALL